MSLHLLDSKSCYNALYFNATMLYSMHHLKKVPKQRYKMPNTTERGMLFGAASMETILKSTPKQEYVGKQFSVSEPMTHFLLHHFLHTLPFSLHI